MNNRDDLLKKLTIMDFILRDISLYLNINPHDEKALAFHNTVASDAEKLRKTFETTCGPLCIRTQNQGQTWRWIEDPWPWEAAANFNLT